MMKYILLLLSFCPGAVFGQSFRKIVRPGAVNVTKTYDVTNLRIPLAEIHEMRPKDHYDALIDPPVEPAAECKWVQDDFRVVEVVVGNEALAFPLRMLEYHELVNLKIGGKPLAIAYCPLCDSASVFFREITREVAGKKVTEVLEFGVSGALYNSNVLLYDRTHKALWSQLAMAAVSGPVSGTSLKHLPIRVVSFEMFKQAHPKGKVAGLKTGHSKPYASSRWAGYLHSGRVMIQPKAYGRILPPKTLGIGILDGNKAYFVTAASVRKAPLTINTSAGDVVLSANAAGVQVTQAPEAVRTIQTFYYSWSAFYPKTKVFR